MNVKWQYDVEPDVGEFGISKQCVLLTSNNQFNVGYWDKNRQEWLAEGLMMGKEYIVAWLEGIEDGASCIEEKI